MTNEESGRAEAEVVAETSERAEVADGAVTVASDEAAERGTALALAGLHLRLGSLALARAELETLAGRGVLDAAARVDLAEVRWRTGDLVGGGEAAREALAGGHDSVVALVVAAEASSALGRPSEARRLAGKALALNEAPIDPVFAGMPRSSVWPGDPAEPKPSPTTLFPPERVDTVIDADREGAAMTAADDRKLLAALEAEADAVAAEHAPAASEPGLWDLHEAAPVAAPGLPSGPPELEPSALFDAGRAAREAGDPATAAVYLGLVVRLAPALAPAVLSAIGEPTDAGLLVVQGDAYRAVGHEIEARRAYTAAISAASAPTAASDDEPAPLPEPAIAPIVAPAATALWWLEPQRDAGSETVAEPDLPAEPEFRAKPEVSAETASTPEPEPWVAPEQDAHVEPEPAPAEGLESGAPAQPDDAAEPAPPPAEPEPSTEFEEAPTEPQATTDQRSSVELEPAPADPDAPSEPEDEAETPGEPEPPPGSEPIAEPDPRGEPEWRAHDASPPDDADRWRNDA